MCGKPAFVMQKTGPLARMTLALALATSCLPALSWADELDDAAAIEIAAIEAEDVAEDAEGVATEDADSEPTAEQAVGPALEAMSSGNDTITNAQPISLNTYTYATTTSPDDSDFYRVTLPSEGQYTLSFASDTQLADFYWAVRVYDYDRNVIIDKEHGESDLSRSEWTGYFPAGAAFIEVCSSNGWVGNLTAGSSYHVRLAGPSISAAAVSGITTKTYTGKAQTQAPVVRMGGATLVRDIDYTLSYKNNKNAGTATVIITGMGDYAGSVSKNFTIAKAANPVTTKAVKRAASFKKLKGKAVTVARPMTTPKAQGKVTYKKASGSAKLTVNKSTGKVTVKKGTKRGPIPSRSRSWLRATATTSRAARPLPARSWSGRAAS